MAPGDVVAEIHGFSAPNATPMPWLAWTPTGSGAPAVTVMPPCLGRRWSQARHRDPENAGGRP
jgi:hypothetical protein